MKASCNFISPEKLQEYAKALNCSQVEVEAQTIVDTYSSRDGAVLENLPNVDDVVRYWNAVKSSNLRAQESNASNIVLTDEQKDAVTSASNFIVNSLRGMNSSGKNYVVIQGKAGTGKTTIVKSIIDAIHEQHEYPRIAFAALSRKAVKVLSGKLKGVGAVPETLYTLSGANPMQGEDRFALASENQKFTRYDLIFVDEASMVSPTIMKAIDEIHQNYPEIAIVFLGDRGQLRPIPKGSGVAKKSEIFDRDDMLIKDLTNRIRQGESSPILPFADNYWEVSVGKSNASCQEFPVSRGKSIISNEGALLFANTGYSTNSKIFQAFKKALDDHNPTYVKIVAARNATVKDWNTAIHNRLFPDSQDKICKGDSVIFNAPYVDNPNRVEIDNAEEGVVTNITAEKEFEGDGFKIKYRNYYIEIDGKSYPVKVIDDNESSRVYKQHIESLKAKAIALAKANVKGPEYSAAWREYYAAEGRFIDTTSETPGMQMSYAITSHKAQGSTYDITIVDETDISSVSAWNNQQRAESIYTGITRARNVVMMLSSKPADVSDYSLVDLSSRIDNKSIPTVSPEEEIKQEDFEHYFVQKPVPEPSSSNEEAARIEELAKNPSSWTYSFDYQGKEGEIRKRNGQTIIRIGTENIDPQSPLGKAATQYINSQYKWRKFDTSNVDTSKVDLVEVDKPWKNDLDKVNPSLRIYLKGQHKKGYFELVKDFESGNYSIHFKTAKEGASYNAENTEYSTHEERQVLFEALTNAIPDGARFSTWGSVSDEGRNAVDKVAKLTGANKVDERDATLKKDDSNIKIPIYQKPISTTIIVSQEQNQVQPIEQGNQNSFGTITREFSAIVAPYYNTSYEDYIKMSPEERSKMREAFSAAARKIAKVVGLTLDKGKISANIGGHSYEKEEDGSVVEPSFTFRFDSDKASKVSLFASLLGDLGYESQEAVIAANYTESDDKEANGIEYTLHIKDAEAAVKVLLDNGIKDFTIDKTKNTIALQLFFDKGKVPSQEELDKLMTNVANVEQSLINSNNYGGETEYSKINSRYLDRGIRKEAYEAWLGRHERNSENWELYDLVKEAFEKLNNKPIKYPVTKQSGTWSRQEVESNPQILYIFTDNTDRDSGSGVIANDSWYARKYGTGHHFPTQTAAVIRGLENARPISTQRWYHQGAKGNTGRWTDADVQEFKSVIEDELKEIVNEFNTGKYTEIRFPSGDGLFNTKISNITKERTPKLYEALSNLLVKYGFESLIPQEGSNTSTQQAIEEKEALPGAGYTIHSGAAKGSDTEWAQQSAAYGMNYIGYKPESLTPELRAEAESKVKEANKYLDRTFPTSSSQNDELILRDWLQVKSADQVVAIAESFVTTRGFDDGRGNIYGGRQVVSGGTGWAVQMAINEGKPVHVYNQQDQKWYHYDNGIWKLSEIPTLTKNFAGIGTRNINQFGKDAISAVLTKNFGTPFGEDTSYTPKHNLSREDLNDNDAVARYANAFNPIERKNRIQRVSRKFSSQLDRLVYKTKMDVKAGLDALIVENENHPSPILERMIAQSNARLNSFNEENTGRTAVLNYVGVQNFLNSSFGVKAAFQEIADMDIEQIMDEWDFEQEEAERFKSAYQSIVDNFDMLFQDAIIDIEQRENISIDTVYDKNYVTKSAVEREIEENENSDDDSGERVNGTEGWSYKVRFTDPYTSASAVTKAILNNIAKVDFEGDYELDDLNDIQYYSGTYIHATLINELSTMIKPEDFYDPQTKTFPALEKVAQKYPWANQIISLLSVETDDNDSKISTFYTDFRKDFISYWMQKRTQDGIMQAFPMNKPNALSGTINQAVQYFETNQKINEDTIYDNGKILLDKIIKGASLISDCRIILKNLPEIVDSEPIYEDQFDSLVESLHKLVGMLGFRTSKKAIQALYNNTDGVRQTRILINAIDDILSKAVRVDTGHFIDKFKDDYNIIAEKIGIVEELDNVQTVRQGDKTFYSYSAPNYYDTLIKQLKQDDPARQAYIDTRFKKFMWFYKDGEWRNEWLKILEEDSNVVKNLDTMQLTVIGNDYYKNWKPAQITESFITQYFTGDVKKDAVRYAWYSSPIFSDSPAAKFVKMVKFTGETPEEMKEKMIPLFRNVVKQEMYRIKLVEERQKSILNPISNFDNNGNKFFFMHELNDYRLPDGEIIEMFESQNPTSFEDLTPEQQSEVLAKGSLKEMIQKELLKNTPNMTKVDSWVNKAVRDIMDQGFEKYWQNQIVNQNLVDKLQFSLGDSVASTEEELKTAIEEYYWNQKFANMEIIQLTTTDLAFYKDLNADGGVDFQKRFKEVYAAGAKLNTNSRYGKKHELTIYLRDVNRSSTGLLDIKTGLERAVASGRMNQVAADDILSKFRNITTTDAQAYRTLKSFRSVLDMMGQWNDRMEKTFNNLQEGNWDMNDFYTIWNTIKPFVFTNTEKPTGVDSKYGETMLVPHQNKNSEFLMMATYGLFSYALNNSSIMRGLTSFMEENDIDVAQFESAVKVGNQGTIDISYSRKKLEALKNSDTWKDLLKDVNDFDDYKKVMDKMLSEGKISQETYNKSIDAIAPSEKEVKEILEHCTKTLKVDTEGNTNPNLNLTEERFNPEVVHSIDYNDYMIAQPTPPHLVDAKAVFGSQFRNIIEADLPSNSSFRVDVNGKNYTKNEIKQLYKSIITENLLDDFEKLKERFGSIEALQKELLHVVSGNPKYGREVRDALQLVDVTDPNTGITTKQFALPVNNPSTTRKLQEIVNSMFKNAIQKQKINGGACILISNFGYTKDLQLLHDKNTGAVIGAECYLPAWSKMFFQEYLNPTTGELQMSKVPKSLRKLIAYRIPTEHKYSMLPLYVKGFLPSQNGSVLMLPMETITNSGEDFDVDKKFLMMPQFVSKNLNIKALVNDFKKTDEGKKLKSEEIEEIIECLESGTTLGTEAELSLLNFLSNANGKYGTLSPEKIEYDNTVAPKDQGKAIIIKAEKSLAAAQERFDKADSPEDKKNAQKALEIAKQNLDNARRRQKAFARAARNNMLIDISYAILTHPDITYQIHHPGNFDNVKRMSRISKILEDSSIMEDLLQQMGGDRSKVITYLLDPKHDAKFFDNGILAKHKVVHNPCEPGTFEYFHRQNMTGDALIGLYANNTACQAKYQESGLAIKDNLSFTINGKKIQDLSKIEVESVRGTDNKLISFNCAEFQAASVDNAKDPVLADLMQNTRTANITGTMLRLGMSIEEIGLMFAQPIIRNSIKKYGSIDKKSIGYSIATIKKNLSSAEISISNDISSFTKSPYTSEELVENVFNYNILNELENDKDAAKQKYSEAEIKKAAESTIKTLILFERLLNIRDDVNTITRISRADSPNGALLPSIAQGKAQIREVELFNRRAAKGQTTLINTENILKNGIVDINMTTDELRENLLSRQLSSLQAFYSLGIELAPQLYTRYFSQGSRVYDSVINTIMNQVHVQEGQFELNGTLKTRRKKSEDVVWDDIYNDMTTFALAQTKLFGDDGEDTYQKKRDYYIYRYPTVFMQKLSDPKNKDIADLDIMQKMQVKNGKICLVNSGRLTADMRDALMRQFDQLLYLDNPEAQQMVENLLKYSYYVEQLNFGPNSFGNYLSPLVISKFPEVITALRNMEKFYSTQQNKENFIEQFFAQRGRNIVHQVRGGIGDPSHLAIKANLVVNTNTERDSYYEYIMYTDSRNPSNNGLYRKINEAPENIIYKRITDYPVQDYIKYNPSTDYESMAKEKFNQLRWDTLSSLQNRISREKSDIEKAVEGIEARNQDNSMNQDYDSSMDEDRYTMTEEQIATASEGIDESLDASYDDRIAALADSDFENMLGAMENPDPYSDIISLQQMPEPFC